MVLLPCRRTGTRPATRRRPRHTPNDGDVAEVVGGEAGHPELLPPLDGVLQHRQRLVHVALAGAEVAVEAGVVQPLQQCLGGLRPRRNSAETDKMLQTHPLVKVVERRRRGQPGTCSFIFKFEHHVREKAMSLFHCSCCGGNTKRHSTTHQRKAGKKRWKGKEQPGGGGVGNGTYPPPRVDRSKSAGAGWGDSWTQIGPR